MGMQMKWSVFNDLKTAAGLFADMRKARKEDKEVTVVVEQKTTVPVFDIGIGFYSTVEGCVLANCRMQGIRETACKAFSELPYETKHLLSYPPEDGIFAERANFWRALLKPVMTPRQYHAAMMEILHWYIHIKKMRKEA